MNPGQRRRILLALSSLFASPLTSVAQQSRDRIFRIGVLSSFSESNSAEWHEGLRRSLRDLGWIEGKNIEIQYRYAQGRNERLPALASDLVRLKVDVIVADESTDALAARAQTATIPIVMASAGAAVEIGLVASLAQPGGNVTGLSQMTPELAGKHLELLKEVVPKLSRVAVLWNPQGKTSELGWKDMQLSAKRTGIQLTSLEVRKPDDFDKAFQEIIRAHVDALATMPHPVFATNLERIAKFAAGNRLPSVFHLQEYAEAGGLMAYGPNRTEMFRRAAAYVDKILKGAKPANLPIEQPTKFNLVVNLRTARAIGLAIPQSVRLRVDRLIE